MRPNVLATNRHVIGEELLDRTEVSFPSAPPGKQGPYTPKLLYANPNWDLALLEIRTSLPPIPLAKSYRFKRGQEIVVIGNPGSLQNAVTLGVLSSEVRLGRRLFHQLSASINPGNSGGPVLNRQGEVVGVVTMKSVDLEGIGLSIPVDHLLESLEEMERLSPAEKQAFHSRHRAGIALTRLDDVNTVYRNRMGAYVEYMNTAVRRGDNPEDGIDRIRDVIQEELDEAGFDFINLVRELPGITSNPNPQPVFREKLGEYYVNCKEIRNDAGNPRGKEKIDEKKWEELTDTANRRFVQLDENLSDAD